MEIKMTEAEPQLFNLQVDPGERFNRADDKPEIVDRLLGIMEQVNQEFGVQFPVIV